MVPLCLLRQSFSPGCIELMIDLLDQLPTRRFFRPLLVDKHVVVPR